MTTGDTAEWTLQFEGLAQLPPDQRDRLVAGSAIIQVPAGTMVFAPGQSADNLLLLLSGMVRVSQQSDNGREVFLYRVHAGESCVLTTACMLSHEDYAAYGQAETEVRAVAIPRATFDQMAGQSPAFRDFIFRAYSRRITDLFTLIENIVFQRMDVRLAARLLELADDQGMVHATHQHLAKELGTAREVISRMLAEFQRRGWIQQSRGIVQLAGRDGLTRLARSTGDL